MIAGDGKHLRGLLAWIVLAAVLMWLAPDPPPVPIYTAEETAVWDRTMREAGENARAWQRDRGDQVLEWDRARGHLAIVIDDVGRELHLLDQLVALRHPLSFSVLPRSVYAMGVQLRLRADGRRYREVWLHLPMEPLEPDRMREGHESEEDFLLAADEDETLRLKIEDALARVPTAMGVNNHMGSRLTQDRRAMDVIMGELAGRNLRFLDSRTTADSVALTAARAHHVPSVARNVFLDHEPGPRAIEAALRQAAKQALNEPTVAIAHPSPALVRVLQTTLPGLHEQGIGIFPLSEIVAHQHTFPASPKG